MTDDDRVFKALADPTRRLLLDRLFERDGRTLTELESGLEMTRFGVMKHLRILEDADLVVTRRSGREKLHFLNPVPIRLIHDRWIDKIPGASGLGPGRPEARAREGGLGMTTKTETGVTTQVYRIYIKATAQAVWDAITKPEWTSALRLRRSGGVRSAPGRRLSRVRERGHEAGARPDELRLRGPDVVVDGEVIESDPPRRLVQTWRMLMGGEDMAAEGFTRLTWEIEESSRGFCKAHR